MNRDRSLCMAIHSGTPSSVCSFYRCSLSCHGFLALNRPRPPQRGPAPKAPLTTGRKQATLTEYRECKDT